MAEIISINLTILNVFAQLFYQFELAIKLLQRILSLLRDFWWLIIVFCKIVFIGWLIEIVQLIFRWV